MASAEFLEQALSTDVDENAVNAIVGSLENQLVTSVPSVALRNNLVNVIPGQLSSFTSSANSIGVQKYNAEQISNSGLIPSSAISNSSVSYNNVLASAPSTFVSQSFSGAISNSGENIKVFSQAPNLANNNRLAYQTQSLVNGCINLATSQNQIHSVSGNSAVGQSMNKTVTMQPPLVIKQGTTTGQVGMQSGLVTMPLTVSSSMPGSMSNVMLNKPGGQNVVVTSQNLGSAQQALIPNVQILNMRPGAPAVAAQKSVATVSPRVVIGTPQVVGARAAAPGITLQTLQSLQPGQPGHLLLKTENGQYQLLRVGPAPTASTLTAPQTQTIRLSTVPAHPGVSTVSTSVATPGPMPGPLPAGPVAAPVVAPTPAAVAPATPPPQPPTVTTQKPSDNTKEKCRNFLANLLDLSSKEPKSVEMNVRNLIQELIDAQVEPEEFCDRLERLLNASPQPCLIGFLKRSLPLLRQSLVTKELVIEGINPPAPHVAFSTVPAPTQQAPVVAAPNVQMLFDEEVTLTRIQPPALPDSPPMAYMPYSGIKAVSVQAHYQLADEGSSSPTLTPLLPPALPVTLAPSIVSSPKPINVVSVQTTVGLQQKPTVKSGSSIAVLQNIPLHTKINVNKVTSKTMTVNNKANFSRAAVTSNALSTVLTPGKSLLKDKEKKSMQFTPQAFADDKMAGDDDINDVAAMGGVNLAEESQRILGSTELIGTQIRSCKDEYLVPMTLMQSRLKAATARHGLEEPTPEVAGLISHAVHERLKNLVEKLACIAQHRIDLIKTDSRYEVTQDVKSQMKFLEELDRVDKKRREDSEREMLLRAAKSRSKNEDPEQAKLKAKAKEMQRAELEELRQREANLTALQAIGPRKKPRLDGPGGSGDSVANGAGHNTSGFSGRSHLALRTRLKRINQRDMVFLLEQERETAHSSMLFRSYLK
ncbi:transcription initiation factor TFIID subunit 4 isoform X2 [Plodia interpunctella]|uniref:transcription initiation factor TFIID subunit 4 isoform X2 n=1 Tax=Plodia interpunctella TaxID=58824 RepID=UPI002367B488|nr:transcription initiation factor TFIID subunit 4 isoform X2 [Plodia interpunctella]